MISGFRSRPNHTGHDDLFYFIFMWIYFFPTAMPWPSLRNWGGANAGNERYRFTLYCWMLFVLNSPKQRNTGFLLTFSWRFYLSRCRRVANSTIVQKASGTLFLEFTTYESIILNGLLHKSYVKEDCFCERETHGKLYRKI